MLSPPTIGRAEWRWAVVVSGIVLLLSALPFALAVIAAPAGWHFAGLLPNPLDGHSYLAKIQQGAGGTWLFHLPFTPEPHQGATIFTFYLTLGHLSRWLGLTGVAVFHAARLAAGLFMLLMAFRFIAIVTPQRRERRLAFVLLVTASGLGWLTVAFGAFPIDLWIPEAFTPYSLYANPHFPLAIGLMLLTLMHLLTASPLMRRTPEVAPLQQGVNLDKGGTPPKPPGLRRYLGRLAGAALMGLLLALALPFALLTLWAVVAAFVGWHTLTQSRRLPTTQIWLTLGNVAGAAPVVLYQLWVSNSNPALAGWQAQNLTPTPSVLNLLLGYGLLGLLALAGAWQVIKQRPARPAEWLVLLWALVTLVLIFAPFSLQRRLITGLHVPLSILAALGLLRGLASLSLRRKTEGLIIGGAVGLGLLGTVFVWLLPLLAALQGPESSPTAALLFIRQDEAAAFEWLRQHGAPDSVVLASERVGMFAPGQSGVRVFYGHPFETLNAEDKRAQLERFFGGTLEMTSPRPDFVFYGPSERALGQPSALDTFTPVFTAETVTLYAVPAE
ncbi:MAG: hypothetical protein Kow0031_25350 [Anaerolineae bacterium]